MSDTVLTVREVAEQVRVSERSVWKYIANGRLQATRLGPRTVRILSSDLDAFLRDAVARSA